MSVNKDHLEDYNNSKESYKHCTTKIRELKKSKKFYVGATHDPEGRLEDHVQNKKMKTMYLLCKTKTKKQAESLEQKLVKVFGNLKTNVDYDEETKTGQSGGGEGLNDGENYIYILFK